MNEQTDRILIRKTKPDFSREQKMGFGLVIGAGCLAFILGGFYLVRHIAEPFFIEYSGEYYFTQEQEKALTIMEQQMKDTDGDTLTDYDELYIYSSSPYLKDTDGDGYNDDTEVASGTDVNCAPGQVCLGVQDDTERTILDDVIADPYEAVENPSTSLAEMQEALNSLSIEEIRDLLITAGADPEMVASIPDDELHTLFLEVMGDLEHSEDFESLE